ncbi:neutrophil defensin 4-like [Carlito syrichta]|uniref:Neutrophil defensin 4-like n=1 Tax=Carlito syrichta TaxID=1868482 RepID=A0A1U7UBZ8_CARSF|nr:neutrophil defensin 4-like [Carlito syrichta]
MKTLALLTAILLVALQVQAEPLQARADEDPAHEQPGAEDQDMAISFTEDLSSGLRASGSTRGLVCFCRIRACYFLERIYGTCTSGGIRYTFCCR